MDIFHTGFWLLVVVCVCLYLYTRTAYTAQLDATQSAFQRTYLIVYTLAMAGDWMQGPYVYALYESYGMSAHDIEVLFVAGFGSSMLFGTIVGSFADKYGRRNNCILYGVLYGLSCLTKHSRSYYILMIGRFLGGIATSILYSAFESWLIYENGKRGFDNELLSTIFSHAILGNSLVAIGGGLVAQQAADIFGYVAPFDVSFIVLLIMIVCIVTLWTENYGDQTVDHIQSYKNAWSNVRSDRKVLYLGLIQSLFEGAMYTFVLEWTPALTVTHASGQPPGSADGEHEQQSLPYGYIFAAFMVAIMIGSSLFKILSKLTVVESFMRCVLLLASCSLCVPILYPGHQLVIFSAFLVFEVCVGIFWPALSTMRSKYVPEATRATIMNLFRVPLNLIVVFILVQAFPMSTIFYACTIFLLIATFTQHLLYRAALTVITNSTTATKPTTVTAPAASQSSDDGD